MLEEELEKLEELASGWDDQRGKILISLAKICGHLAQVAGMQKERIDLLVFQCKQIENRLAEVEGGENKRRDR